MQKIIECFGSTANQQQTQQQTYSRFYTHLGKTSQGLLTQHMLAVDKFVEDTQKSTKNEQMQLSIQSHALKRSLAREVAIKYKESANLFTDFKKTSDAFIIKRWYKRNNNSSAAQKATPQKPSQESTTTTSSTQEEVKDAAEVTTITEQISTLSLAEQNEQKHQEFLLKEAEDLYNKEMGFALVVEELAKARKPIVGHNMIYDIIYLYNQFIDDLPQTYNEFVKEWNLRFPSVYDNKVLSSAAEYFGRTDLGKVYEKC